jgi:hypothetical protein
MNETTIVITCVALLAVIGIFFYIKSLKKMDFFDITVDPVPPQQPQQKTSECDKNSCGLINTSDGPTYKKFIKAYKGTLDNHNNMINYCTFMYENYHSDFTRKWHSLSDCEARLENGFYED